MTFLDSINNLPLTNITRDTYRSAAIEFLVAESFHVRSPGRCSLATGRSYVESQLIGGLGGLRHW